MSPSLCGDIVHNENASFLNEQFVDAFDRLNFDGSVKEKSKTNEVENTKEMNNVQPLNIPKKLVTEDTGKVFEKAICLKYGIAYQGNYKYGEERALAIQPLLEKLPSTFPQCVHTAEKGSQYDFTSTDGQRHLSAKTCKRSKGKVAPQQFGQCSVQKLWDKMGWAVCVDDSERRKLIQDEVRSLMPLFETFTFDCDVIYYHEKKQEVKYIKKLGPIEWNKEEFSWTKTWDKWSNSTTLKVKRGTKFISIFEFQFHSGGRSNMCNRWILENVLESFAEKFEVVTWKRGDPL